MNESLIKSMTTSGSGISDFLIKVSISTSKSFLICSFMGSKASYPKLTGSNWTVNFSMLSGSVSAKGRESVLIDASYNVPKALESKTLKFSKVS